MSQVLGDVSLDGLAGDCRETRDSLVPVSQLDFGIGNEQKKLRHSMNIAQTCSKTQVLEGSESGSTLPVNGI